MSDTRKPAQTEGPQAPSRATLKVLIADEHFVAREGLKVCLHTIERNIAVIDAETLEAAIAICRSSQDIDLVLLDFGMFDGKADNALDTFMQACPQQRVAVLSAPSQATAARGAIEKGARGFLPKNMGKNDFIDALKIVLAGEVYAPAETRAPVARNKNSDAADAWRNAKFTARQIDVLARLIEGKPNKQICKELNLALGTVKTHVGAILGALEVSSRAEAIVTAERSGLRGWLEQHQPEDATHRR